ncbi:MAG: Stp1/IreP family PP2C-type Ser/Thr phosphatase [Clostridia bacterium]|nr:Stp1/IreP family PP2C-type Ser/Thr phosphatase [Clostridia bacterium]
MKIFSKTDVGLVRLCNQDAMTSGSFEDGTAWAVVCDGMGGANGGEVASSEAIDVISRRINESYRSDMTSSAIRTMLESAVLEASFRIFDISRADTSLSGMGTTVVIAIVCADKLYTAHAGDSRAYILGKDGARQITTDHSIVQEMVELGQITADEAKHHPRRNIITRALGVNGFVEVDFGGCEYRDGDIVLLCTDGLSNLVEPEELLSLALETELENLPERYIEAACEKGGNDNITAVVMSR